jgi:hypothetical protein
MTMLLLPMKKTYRVSYITQMLGWCSHTIVSEPTLKCLHQYFTTCGAEFLPKNLTYCAGYMTYHQPMCVWQSVRLKGLATQWLIWERGCLCTYLARNKLPDHIRRVCHSIFHNSFHFLWRLSDPLCKWSPSPFCGTNIFVRLWLKLKASLSIPK